MDWRDLAKLQQEQDQDEAEALAWWRDTPNEAKLDIWLLIQKDVGHPIIECLHRFAQVGMTRIAILALERERNG